MSSPLFAGPAGPSRYQESPPSASVAAVVACRWVGSGGWDRRLRLMPDGCADLVWDGTAVLLVGSVPGAARFPVSAEAFNVGLRVRPGVAGALAGCRASDLPPAPVPLADLWGAAPARALSSTLAAAAEAAGRSGVAEVACDGDARPGEPAPVAAAGATARRGLALDDSDSEAADLRTAAQRRLLDGATSEGTDVRTAAVHWLLERAVVERLGGGGGGCGGRRGRRVDLAVVEAARLLRRPGVTVDGVASAVGLSARELRRRFPDHVGYGPKALHRVLRFRRFLDRAPSLVAGSASLATAAAEAGYADQSHLGRDCRRLSGSSPAVLVRRWADAVEAGRNVPDRG